MIILLFLAASFYLFEIELHSTKKQELHPLQRCNI